MKGDYVIIGDTDKYKDCLVCVVGKELYAYETLNRMMRNPTEEDKKLMKEYKNLRVSFVEEERCWWNWNCD